MFVHPTRTPTLRTILELPASLPDRPLHPDQVLPTIIVEPLLPAPTPDLPAHPLADHPVVALPTADPLQAHTVDLPAVALHTVARLVPHTAAHPAPLLGHPTAALLLTLLIVAVHPHIVAVDDNSTFKHTKKK